MLTHASLLDWYQTHQEEILNDFITFLSFPSISTDSHYNPHTLETANWVAEYLKKVGMNTEIWKTSRHPVVFGSYLKAGPERPTLLIYHHYDVQPVDPLNLWHSDPFRPVVKNNTIYARGASDNKGQCFYSLCALRAFLSQAEACGVNIKIFIEGEEESGGEGTFALLPHKKEALKADYLLIVDTDLPRPGVPGITLGVRGIVSMSVEWSNSKIDLHSGTHGGIALNPNRVLAQCISQLWDAKGSVAVPGFYDGVLPPSQEELAQYDSTFEQREYMDTFGVKGFANETGVSLRESNWLRPTLEINGISGGYAGAGFKTVIPSKALAKISCRLVPNQDPKIIGKRVIDFLEFLTPKGMTFKSEFYGGAAAYRCNASSEIAQIAKEAYEEVFRKPCVSLLCGASIPIVGALAEASGAEALLMGVALAEDDIHAPNEHFGLDRFKQGFLTMASILQRLSQCQTKQRV